MKKVKREAVGAVEEYGDRFEGLLRGLKPKTRRWFRLVAEGMSGMEAAVEVGYGQPERIQERFRRLYPRQSGKAEELWRERQNLQPDEIRRLIAEVSRGKETAFKEGAQVASVRLKALELASRMHGMLSDKLDVTLSRKDLIAAIKEKMIAIESSAAEELKAETSGNPLPEPLSAVPSKTLLD